MTKITLTDLVNLQNENTSVNAINTNNNIIELAFDNTLSRDGTNPNQMNANLDMNSKHILNLPTPSTSNEPARLQDLATLTGGGSIIVNPLPVGGTINQVLAKNSSTNFDTSWKTFGGLNVVTTRTALAALDTTTVTSAFLTEAGREGSFVWKLGDFSALITGDVQQGIYVKATAVLASVGSWVRVRTDGVYNVKWFGATGDGVTNDYTAIQAAITLAGLSAGGDVLIPQGGYLVNTGLTITTPLTRIVGVGKRYCSIKTSQTNISLITITAARCGVVDLSLFQQVVPTVTSALITLGSGAVQCTLDDLDMVGGWYCIQGLAGSTNCLIKDLVARLALGGASFYTLGAGAYIVENCVFDQDWPAGVPSTANDKGARTNVTSYALKDVVNLSGILLQCSQAGTSGGSAPSLTGIWFGTTITDGTVKWLIAGNALGTAVTIDSGSSYITFKDCDMTGSYLYGGQVINGLGTTPPDVTRFFNCTVGAILSHGFNIVAGKGLWIEGCELQACLGAGATRSGILIGAGYTGESMLRGNRITSSFINGIYIQNVAFGSNTINGNMIFGLTTAIKVDPNVLNFIITDNNVGTSALYGNNTNSIVVSAGVSDHYIISQNRTTPAISDGGTGVNKSVTANIQ